MQRAAHRHLVDVGETCRTAVYDDNRRAQRFNTGTPLQELVSDVASSLELFFCRNCHLEVS